MPSRFHGVRIHGEGVAAASCAHLLSLAGIPLSATSVPRVPVPAVMLADSALYLIGDVFGDPALLRNLPRIRKRFVLWGEGDVVALDHSAIIASEPELLAALAHQLPSDADAAWTIFAAGPLPHPVSERRFGTRLASAVAVDLRSAAEPEACWIEAVDTGWLFLITHAPGAAWLLCVGGEPAQMLGLSRLVAQKVDRHDDGTRQFPCAPRMVSPVCAPGWLACGTAAMAFDPICGDGTAHAVREAILASAVIRAVFAGGDQGALLRHYEGRLTAGFRKHLELCRRFYESGSRSPWWREQADAVESGLRWCDERLRQGGGQAYRLNGFQLEPVA